MKIYISIPLHGHTEEDCRKRAERAKNYVSEVIQRGLRETLKDFGLDTKAPFTVVTPFDVAENLDFQNKHSAAKRRLLDVDYLLEDLRNVGQSNLVIVTDGWESSRGCMAEVAFAQARGIDVVMMSEALMVAQRTTLGDKLDRAARMSCTVTTGEAFLKVFQKWIDERQRFCPGQKSLNQYPIDDLPF